MSCKKYSKILAVRVSRRLLKRTASVEVLQLQEGGLSLEEDNPSCVCEGEAGEGRKLLAQEMISHCDLW